MSVTIYDIARLTGTNITAVSRAFRKDSKLSKAKRELILKVAKEQGYRPNSVAGSLSRKIIHIGVAYRYEIPDFAEEQLRGIQECATRLVDFRVKVEIVKCTSSKQVEETLWYFAQKGYEGVLTNCLPAGQNEEAFVNALEDQGVAVALLTTDRPTSKRSIAAVNDVNTAGAIACDLLKMLGAGREVLLFTGTRGYVHDGIVQGFRTRAEEIGVRLADVVETEDQPERAEFLAKEALASHPGVTGIYVTSANSIPVLKQVVLAGKAHKVRIITSDVFSALSAFIREGTVDATIYQAPARQAELALENLYLYLVSGEAPSVVTVSPEIVVAGNLHLYETERKRNS
ncbi:MAG: substrate-binding domain-containing protein [Clostridia bacterium]|nr:substrate-binding domain-containing protein [Clostridia bacterium]MBQ1943097.1 substrate-binding domain-containing protein [Clostridia bacterium]MBQ5802239.1 substrate-binding domain-containing protein [Clostridia bacterium]